MNAPDISYALKYNVRDSSVDSHQLVKISSTPARQSTQSASDSVSKLEQEIEKLEHYGAELLELSLVDSHTMLMETVAKLKRELQDRKRDKSLALIERLRVDFPGLAEQARDEIARLGYLS
jgi:hypothetical protein